MDKSRVLVASLGDYITLINRKNKDLGVTKLVGVTSDKQIINSSWCGKNTNLSICLLISHNQFVVRLMDIEKTNKLAIGLYKEKDLSIVSSQYHVFEIRNSNLLSDYLMLLFKRQLTELQLLYMCFGGIRGELGWDNFIKLPIYVPPLETQQRIVNKYESLERIIQLKKEVNEKLEKWMQSLFHVMFDGLKEFTNETFGSLFQIVKGGRPPRTNEYLDKLYFCKEGGIPWLQISDITKKKYKFISDSQEQLTKEGFKKSKCSILGGGIFFSLVTPKKSKLKT